MLPESILSFILSKIPLKDAVRCGILSKRWRFLCTQMAELTVATDDFLWPDCPSDDPLIMSSAENIISNILLLYSRNLEGFHIYSTSIVQRRYFSRENVSKWVRYASLSNVKNLNLWDNILEELPPPTLFSCSHLIIGNSIGADNVVISIAWSRVFTYQLPQVKNTVWAQY